MTMKRITYLLIAMALIFQGCEEYLDKVPESAGMTEEDVFTDYLNYRKFEDRMYKDMLDPLHQFDYTQIAALCDEGYNTSDWETMPIAQAGDWLRSYNTGQALQFYAVWNAWESIRIANISIQNIPMLEESGNATQEQINQLKGQAHFMRAWYYFEFLRRQGGMPYITRPLKGTDNFALPRLSYHETALKIAADCDTAASLLPLEWDMAHLGRPTRGAAMALKASTLLFDASPTNNPSNDASRWTAAAEAAWEVIELARNTGIYKLMESKGTDEIKYMTPGGVETIEYPSGFDSIFMYTPYNEEIIWEFYARVNNGGTHNPFTVASLSSPSIIQGFSPSQNIVEMFETANGLAIEDDPGYDSQDPWVDRDPRFYHSILFNQERWTSKTDLYLELWEGGSERINEPHYSKTGYLARKFWGKNVDSWSGAPAPYTHSIFFRYAEILLMYAEAANEVGGPNHVISGADMSAVEAVNMVRARVNMPEVNAMYLGSKESFRERIKNERAVELYLEGKRLFDLSRWGDAHKMKHKAIYGISLTEDLSKPTGFIINRTTDPVFVLTFEQKHYRWPIPTQDALMFEEFEQNPGW
ncbi:MAG TPA: RagB/SusD family nutrient uptake outer membrane protein [Bacteroidetes bacterium]|nr:RagB/SusD family nutrient uptake outer membrane protein [Bacteroidota bacterium]